jgi:sortase A
MTWRSRAGWWLVGLGALALGAPLWPPLLAHAGQVVLKRQPLPAAPSRIQPGEPVAAPATPVPAAGTPVAKLDIPALAVDAVVVAGSTDWNLIYAPTWVMSTALPGQAGTAVIAAHNMTFFRHLNRLKPGDPIWVTTPQGWFRYAVTGATVVAAGQTIPNTARPSLVLEACYPLDALYLTPYRYLVFARLTASRLQPEQLPPPSTAWPYQAAVPPVIAQHYSLALSAHHLLMGTLTYAAPPTTAVDRFEASTLPYDVAAETLSLYFASRIAAATDDVAAYRAMTAPGVPLPPFWGALPRVDGRTNLTLQLTAGGQPLGAQLNVTGVTWGDRAVSALTMTVAVDGSRLVIAGWRLP